VLCIFVINHGKLHILLYCQGIHSHSNLTPFKQKPSTK
jgi:hypothetical protein